MFITQLVMLKKLNLVHFITMLDLIQAATTATRSLEKMDLTLVLVFESKNNVFSFSLENRGTIISYI